MKYEFRCIEQDREVVVKSENVTLQDLLQDFEDFLRGCGFSIKGSIEVVEEDNG